MSTLEQPDKAIPASPRDSVGLEHPVSAEATPPSFAFSVAPTDIFSAVEENDLTLRCYAHALETVHEAVFFAAPEGRILYANRAARVLGGFDPQDPPDHALFDLVPQLDRGKFSDRIARLERGDDWTGEATLVLLGGRMIPVRMTLTAVRGAQGQVQALIASCRDLSECRRLEENLRQAQKLEAVGLLASGLAHNINSPLAAIIVTAEMTQAKYPQMREFQDIMQASARIQEIIANLMTKSRQEQSTEETAVDLNQLVKTELKFLEANLFFKHQVELDLILDPDLPRRQGLYSDFSQCFYNLVQNALDAMQEACERRLTIRTGKLEGGRILFLSVADTGCGIADTHLPRIFEPFFTTKLDNNHRFDHVLPSGTGLGLSTSLRLMEKYGATLHVTSRVGVGSEFQVRIPAENPGGQPAEAPKL